MRVTRVSTLHPILSTTAARSSSRFHLNIAAGKILMPMEIQPKYYLRSLADEKCTGGWNTVPVWSDVVNAILSGEVKLEDYDLSALTHIEIGAQPVPYVSSGEFKESLPQTARGQYLRDHGRRRRRHHQPLRRRHHEKPGFIGKPTVFMEAKVVDDKGNECPPGTVGELLLKGPRLMKEYAYNPEMTARPSRTDGFTPGTWRIKMKKGFLLCGQGERSDHPRRGKYLSCRDRGIPAEAS